MRRLILFRHGKAEVRAQEGGDINRPLAKRGREDSALMGRLLAEQNLAPDLGLVSSALRARQTWDCARTAFPNARQIVSASLYEASPERLMAQLSAIEDPAETIAVVGHNPGLHELAVNLVLASGGGGADLARLAAKFPTASVATFVTDGEGRFVFDGLFLVRDHGGEGG